MKLHEEINFARALLILMVVLIHIVHFGELYPETKSIILSFMMPSFLLITGYLTNIEKTPCAFCGYILRIAVPYVVMVSSFSLLSYYLPVRDRITELSVSQFAERIFVSSIGPYWFFYVMLVCSAVFYISFKYIPFLGNNLFARFAVFGFLLTVLSFVLPILSIQTVVYYFIGTILRQTRCDYSAVFRPTPYAILPFIALIIFGRHRDWADIAVFASVFCFLSFSSWCFCKLGTRAKSAFSNLGMNTLPIFLFHPIFTLSSKYYLRFFTWDSTGFSFIIITIFFSMFGSLLIARVLDATNLSCIFARKKFLR